MTDRGRGPVRIDASAIREIRMRGASRLPGCWSAGGLMRLFPQFSQK
jgi:hypothetical protein